MKPIIGITLGYKNNRDKYLQISDRYSQCVKTTGGIPIFISPHLEDGNEQILINRLDGIILSGGGDMDPIYFSKSVYPENGRIDPMRDRTEYILLKSAIKNKIPVLAICRGIQVMNIICGGTIYQNLPDGHLQHFQDAPPWYGIHEIKIKSGSCLHKIFSARNIRVNSFHHQAVDVPGNNISILAYSKDGITEALKINNHPFALGVQWHPEEMYENQKQMNLFSEFIFKARKFRR